MRRGSNGIEQVLKELRWNKCIFHKRKREKEALSIMEMREAGQSEKGAAE